MKNLRDVILILRKADYKIIYTNIDEELARKYMEELDIISSLHKDTDSGYIIDDYCIRVDECIISKENYYVINIGLKSDDCINCIKALIDRPTGLYNRNYLEEIKSNDPSSDFMNYFLILIDIDHLKKINDNYGHLQGDKAIEIVGQSITNSIRKKDIGIRYGGDEFIVLVFNAQKDAVNKVVERIKKEIKEQNKRKNMNVKVSIGISFGNCFTDLNKAIKKADEKLYKQKDKLKENFHAVNLS